MIQKLPHNETKLRLPYFSCSVEAGWPSPAESWLEGPLDFNDLLVPKPAATFVLRVSGTSMTPIMDDGDLIVVDRSKQARRGNIVVAAIDGDLTVKRLGDRCLMPENPIHSPIPVGDAIVIWGVVSFVIRAV